MAKLPTIHPNAVLPYQEAFKQHGLYYGSRTLGNNLRRPLFATRNITGDLDATPELSDKVKQRAELSGRKQSSAMRETVDAVLGKLQEYYQEDRAPLVRASHVSLTLGALNRLHHNEMLDDIAIEFFLDHIAQATGARDVQLVSPLLVTLLLQ
ncbi:hypothetical protein KIPB_000462, partial [Kipferlia bialata]|eukprot:g462.t1